MKLSPLCETVCPTSHTTCGKEGCARASPSPAGPLPVERAIAIARGVASGLAAAYAKGIIHRDIKPDNILLDHGAFHTSRTETPKLLDFGIAAVKETSTAMSRTRGFMLTAEYAAPEQWMGMPSDQIDGRTDLYALGGVLHEMLTGTTWLHSQTFDGWMYQHLQAERTAPSQKRPELANWAGLDALVLSLSLLAKDRDHRPANAFIEGLDKLNQKRSAKSYKTNQAAAIVARSEYLQKFPETLSSKPDDKMYVPGNDFTNARARCVRSYTPCYYLSRSGVALAADVWIADA